MGRKKHNVEQIIGRLRQAEVLVPERSAISDAVRQPKVTEQTYYHLLNGFGGMRADQAIRIAIAIIAALVYFAQCTYSQNVICNMKLPRSSYGAFEEPVLEIDIYNNMTDTVEIESLALGLCGTQFDIYVDGARQQYEGNHCFTLHGYRVGPQENHQLRMLVRYLSDNTSGLTRYPFGRHMFKFRSDVYVVKNFRKNGNPITTLDNEVSYDVERDEGDEEIVNEYCRLVENMRSKKAAARMFSALGTLVDNYGQKKVERVAYSSMLISQHSKDYPEAGMLWEKIKEAIPVQIIGRYEIRFLR